MLYQLSYAGVILAYDAALFPIHLVRRAMSMLLHLSIGFWADARVDSSTRLAEILAAEGHGGVATVQTVRYQILR